MTEEISNKLKRNCSEWMTDDDVGEEERKLIMFDGETCVYIYSRCRFSNFLHDTRISIKL